MITLKWIIFNIVLFITINAMAQPDFYHLNVDSNNVKFTCYLNGFPVYSSEDKFDATVSMPVQLYLIGKGNTLMIDAEAIDKSKVGRISALVEPYQKGDVVATNTTKEGDKTLNMEIKERTKTEMTFDNERFDYSALLVNGDKLGEKEVIEYAKKLRKYVENADAKGFVSEMELKIADYSAANDYSANDMRQGLTQQFEQTFFKKKQPAIPEDNISAVSFDEGRIWEIRIEGREFLKLEEDGGSMQMSVYVGSVNGTLGIVR